MKKIHLNLSVNKELVDKAKDQGIVISKFLENKLQEYFSFIEAVSKPQNTSLCGYRDLNPSKWLGKPLS